MFKKLNKSIIGVVAVIVALGILWSCSDDIVLEPLPSLIGDYEGEYRYITNYGQPNQQTKSFAIEWRFTDFKYNMYATTEDLCSPFGSYELADNVTIEQDGDGCSEVVSNPEMNPEGVFSLRQPEDSVILDQIVGDIRKTVLLKKTR